MFLDTPGIIQDKRNKMEERMMASVQQVGRGVGVQWGANWAVWGRGGGGRAQRWRWSVAGGSAWHRRSRGVKMAAA